MSEQSPSVEAGFSFTEPVLGESNFTLVRPPDVKRPQREFIGARIYRAAALSHTSSGNWQSIALDTVNLDPHNLFDATGTLKIPTGLAGYWAVMGAVAHAASASTFSLGSAIYVNSTVGAQNFTARGGENDTLVLPVNEITYLNSGDFLTLYGYQNSGGNFAYVPGGSTLWLGAYYLGTTGGQP